MKEILEKTESVCPICLSKISAKRIVQDNNVFIEKKCFEHGYFKALIWRDAETYKEWGAGEDAPGPEKRFTITSKGCPYDCGLCPNHEAETCTVVMEVTLGCSLHCPICYASSKKGLHKFSLDEIRIMYQTVLEAGGPYPIQLSGGEPTERDDLAQIVSMGKKMGFYHIQINTHGLRLAKDKNYLQQLKDNGVDLIYLQFDGLSDDVYHSMRGASLFEYKVQAIRNCLDFKLGVILVPTIIPGINDHQIGDIVNFAKKWIPVVKGVHFQPVSYFGRYPKMPEDQDRITIPDILQRLEIQTMGEIRHNHFLPRRRKDSHCGFSGFFVLTEDNSLRACVDFDQKRKIQKDSGLVKESPAQHTRRFINKRGRYVEVDRASCKKNKGTWENFFERSKTHYLSISGMPFQDAWTVDLERLVGCCIHVVTPRKKLIPFCSYYLTNMNGERLHHYNL
jgi:uncharacterized radical SAM superfamily Fe-S cluster-containing enzyme